MKRSIARLVCSVFLCCALLVVCAELLSAYGAGSSEDPLITYSYIQKTFLPKLLEGPEKDAAELLADEAREKELKSHGDAVVADLTYENLADAAAVRMLVSVGELSIPSVTGQRKVKLDSGLAVVAEEGATVTVLGGSIKAVPESSGTIILVGAREELETETELALGDYAVVTEKGRVIFIPSGEATVTVTGRADFKPCITGKISITGKAREGETLSANLSGANLFGDISYSWQADGVQVSDAEKYRLTSDDVGKKITVSVISSGEGCGKLTSKAVTVESKIISTPMYRLYNPNSGEHFYTGSIEERDTLTAAGWVYEGVAWNAPTNSGQHVHRLYNPNSGDHHYTMSEEERDMLVSVGWIYEGVCWNSASASNIPLYRLYNPNADCGSHHYTGSEEERDMLVSLGWIYEGIGWYGMLK